MFRFMRVAVYDQIYVVPYLRRLHASESFSVGLLRWFVPAGYIRICSGCVEWHMVGRLGAGPGRSQSSHFVSEMGWKGFDRECYRWRERRGAYSDTKRHVRS